MKEVLICVLLALSFQVSANTEQDIQRQISELKAEPSSQHERIKGLETMLDGNRTNSEQKVIVGRFAWQNSANWRKIKLGMSRSQVESIMGKPSKIKTDSIGYVSLFYQGEIQDAGYVSGNVQLNNMDRVYLINPPVM